MLDVLVPQAQAEAVAAVSRAPIKKESLKLGEAISLTIGSGLVGMVVGALILSPTIERGDWRLVLAMLPQTAATVALAVAWIGVMYWMFQSEE